MKKILIFILISVMMIFSWACSTAQKADSNGSILLSNVNYDDKSDADIASLSQETNQVLTDSYFEIFRQSYDPNTNSLVSPYSIMQAFAMCANGAEGETLAEIEKAFGLSEGEMNQWCKVFYADMRNRETAPLNTANSFWYNDNDKLFTVNQDFADNIGRYFDAESYKAPFNQHTVGLINQWVKDNTGEKIDSILDSLEPNDISVLINAVYFDGKWVEPYSDEAVTDDKFTGEDGSVYDVELMHSGEDAYLEGKNFTGFSKPYVDNYSFVALLPKEGVTIEELVNSVDGKTFTDAINNSASGHVDAAVPKFEYKYEIKNMVPIMEKLGIGSLFSAEKCDLSGIGELSEGNLFVSDVIHKTYINMNEEGTEAAAVTGMMMKATAMPAESYTVILDRPFLYAIIDSVTGVPVFIGTCMDFK